MQEFIARANIARFEALIASEPDDAKRQLLEEMLDREKATLNGLGVAQVAPTATGEPHALPPRPQLNRNSPALPAK